MSLVIDKANGCDWSRGLLLSKYLLGEPPHDT